jgi:hypothetical protein
LKQKNFDFYISTSLFTWLHRSFSFLNMQMGALWIISRQQQDLDPKYPNKRLFPCKLQNSLLDSCRTSEILA